MSLKAKVRKLFPGGKLIEKGRVFTIKRVPMSTTLADIKSFRSYLTKNGGLEMRGDIAFFYTDKGAEIEWIGKS